MSDTGHRLRFLDGLRGVATLVVVVFHLPLITSPQLTVPTWAQSFVMYGGAGVTLFFVISAFSLCLTMPGHARTGTPLVSFYVKRLLRIAPLFYLTLAYWVVNGYHLGGPLPPAWLVLLDMSFLFNLAPAFADSLVFAGWTLGVEVLFYLFFPLVDRHLQGVARKGAALLLSLAAYPVFLGLLDALHLPADVAARYSLLTICLYLPAFAAGMLAYELSRSVRSPAGPVLIALAALTYTLLVAGRLDGVLAAGQWQAICFGLLLLGMAVREAPSGRGSAWVAAGGFMGKISYSVYLLHGPLILAINPALQRVYRLPLPVTLRFLLANAVALAVIVPACWVSYQLVERPFIRLGRVLVDRHARRRGHLAVGVP